MHLPSLPSLPSRAAPDRRPPAFSSTGRSSRASPPSSVQTPVSYICLLTKKRLEKDKIQNPKDEKDGVYPDQYR